jgi:hypothetical protein
MRRVGLPEVFAMQESKTAAAKMKIDQSASLSPNSRSVWLIGWHTARKVVFG